MTLWCLTRIFEIDGRLGWCVMVKTPLTLDLDFSTFLIASTLLIIIIIIIIASSVRHMWRLNRKSSIMGFLGFFWFFGWFASIKDFWALKFTGNITILKRKNILKKRYVGHPFKVIITQTTQKNQKLQKKPIKVKFQKF